MVMDCVNYLLVSGTLEHDPTVRFQDNGKAVCRGALRIDELSANGGCYKTFLQFEAYGKTGEAVGACRANDVVMLQGKIFWRKYQAKSGEEKSGLALLVQKCSVLIPAVALSPHHKDV